MSEVGTRFSVMFEDVPAGQVLDAVDAHQYLDPLDRAGQRVDAIRALDRVIRAAQARQAEHIVALHDDPHALGLSRLPPSTPR